MIIQCEQCRTKFKLDDEKVSEKGVKVRCAKCKHVFTVRKEADDTLNMPQPLVAVSGQPDADSTMQAVTPPDMPQFGFEAPAAAPAPEVAFDFGAPAEPAPAAGDMAFDFGDIAFSTESPASQAAALDFGEKTMVMPPKKSAEPEPDFGNFDFGAAPAPATELPGEAAVSFDFSEAPASTPAADAVVFDFGDAPAAAVTSAGEFDFGTSEAAPAATDVDFGSFDFGAVTEPSASVDHQVASGEEFSFEPAGSTESGADSFDLSTVDFGAVSQTAESAPQTADVFSMGELDFSTETSAVSVEEPVAAAQTSTLFTPVEDVSTRSKAGDGLLETPGAEGQQLPTNSRRREGSSPMVMILAAVLILAVLGYVAYMFISGKGEQPGSKAGVTMEDGRIAIRAVKAYYIPKSAAGELLVITGEAVNNYKKPRASLQLKGMVFAANGQVLATRSAYAGNQLTREQLVGMPADKIDAAMNNQFGDSLANMGVEPGKVIPFTIVILNPPKEGKEFGVEAVGSTVAAASK